MHARPGWTRRTALKATAGGIAAWAFTGCDDSSRPAVDPYADVDPTRCDIEALADSLVAEAEDGLRPLGDHLRAGVPRDALFGAALLVAARSVAPDGDLHDVLVVPSAFFLSTRLTGTARNLPLARAWAQHVHAVPDALAPLDPTSIPASAGDLRAIEAAFDAWDGDAAQRALARRYVDHGPSGVIDVLARYGTRNHDWVGHTAIWTSLALRACDALGWDCAPWLLRSVAGAIAGRPSRAVAADFEINRERIRELPADWARGADRPDAVPGLVDALLLAEPQTGVDVIIDATRAGLSLRTIWTALSVTAVEHAVRWDSASFGVHELDAVNALRHLQGFARTDETARLILLQAAAWRGLFQAFDPQPPGIEERLHAIPPSDGAPSDPAALVETVLGSRGVASRTVAGYVARGGEVSDLQPIWAETIAANAGRDHHHIKYHTALMEEIDAALPAWRSTLALGMVMRGPPGRGPAWSRADEARAL